MANNNRYDPDKHDDFVKCPRPSCSEQNAPPESDEFRPDCWKCGEHLNIQPVSIGDELEVDVEDMHESGAGVGHTEDGFVVLVDGVLPEKRVQTRITKVKERYATGELLEVISDDLSSEEEVVDEEGEEEEEDHMERLGSRENWWGG